MRVVVAGSSGLIGTALCRSLTRDGHEVTRLVRRQPQARDERRWDPAAPDPALVDGADVVVNFAGAGLGGRRWTRRDRDVVLHSRTGTAGALAVMAARAATPPARLLSASGIRFYGLDRGEEILTEASAPGTEGLLPGITRAWEAATGPAGDAGVAVCHLRMGLVLSRHGGILPKLLPPFRAGLGATLGDGDAFWSYIALGDTVRAIRFLATLPGAAGPYNLTTPDPVRGHRFTQALAAAVGRPALLRLPRWAVRAALGQIPAEVLGSLRVVPARLTEAGFRPDHPDLASVLRGALAG